MTKPLIAVVNDDTAFLNLMHDLLTEEGYQTKMYIEADAAYRLIKHDQPDLVILDIRMQKPEGGWNVLELLRLDPSTVNLPVIICSADSTFLRAKAEVLREQHCDILEKPFELGELLRKIEAMIGAPPSHEEN